MANIMESVKTINSSVRTVIMLVLFGGLGFGGWFGYTNYLKPGIDAKNAQADLDALQVKFNEQQAAMKNLQVVLADTEKENLKLQTSLKLLKVDRRIGNLTIIEKGEKDGKPFMDVRFTEVNDQGKVIGVPRDFTINGNEFFVDCWIVTFDDHYVENNDALRSGALCVFKGIYGEIDGPMGAQSLDRQYNTSLPEVYSVAGKNEFEQQIWSDFWTISNDRSKQKELGIRASYANALHLPGVKGQSYRIELRASGGASLKPIEKSDIDLND